MAKDLVCNMEVDENKTPHQTTHKVEKYYFCSVDCKKAFEIAPEKYVKKKGHDQNITLKSMLTYSYDP